MGKIFISYRRDDDPNGAARVRDSLAARFGKSAIFMDVDNLLAGQKFDAELSKALAQCDVLVAVIGARWSEVLRAKLEEAAADPDHRDYVRDEIAGALQRGIPVVPVRVGREGALPALPRPSELPAEISDLVLHHKHDVRHETFGRDAADLAAAIRMLQRQGKRPGRRWAGVAAALAWVLGAVAIGAHLSGVAPWLPPKAQRDGGANADAAERKARADAEAREKQLAEAADKARRDQEARVKAERDEAARKQAEDDARARAAAEAKRKADEAAAEASKRQRLKETTLKGWLTAPGYWAIRCGGGDGNIYKIDGVEIEYTNPHPNGSHGHANYEELGGDSLRLTYIKRPGGFNSDVVETIDKIDSSTMKIARTIDRNTDVFVLHRCDCSGLSGSNYKLCNSD